MTTNVVDGGADVTRVPADDRGVTTAEYALCAVSAVAFAGVLYAILTGDTVNDVLTNLVVDALSSGV
ncbi:DUF4244 domain-containing protein [Nocardiopsis sp. EMB25]|uniref:DUF4244 domain-containing protein n=1 Tax=Nocardiopsis TaxID=2013 RepID=UPI00034CF93A|nr:MULTISPECIES: DUF4244 domain-containing protein [Nocardiopsis]MCY9786459.1 DUF4244 domain-containing protein [Nocardiopsis sp. EMB25]